jgi:hypothetical protein
MKERKRELATTREGGVEGLERDDGKNMSFTMAPLAALTAALKVSELKIRRRSRIKWYGQVRSSD